MQNYTSLKADFHQQRCLIIWWLPAVKLRSMFVSASQNDCKFFKPVAIGEVVPRIVIHDGNSRWGLSLSEVIPVGHSKTIHAGVAGWPTSIALFTRLPFGYGAAALSKHDCQIQKQIHSPMHTSLWWDWWHVQCLYFLKTLEWTPPLPWWRLNLRHDLFLTFDLLDGCFSFVPVREADRRPSLTGDLYMPRLMCCLTLSGLGGLRIWNVPAGQCQCWC